jgi:ABC-type Fe3+ transport system substrate-binding protein
MDWALSREGQALMVELGSFASMTNAPMPPGVDARAIKTWYPDDDEVEKIFKPWTDDWNKAYNYRQ